MSKNSSHVEKIPASGHSKRKTAGIYTDLATTSSALIWLNSPSKIITMTKRQKRACNSH